MSYLFSYDYFIKTTIQLVNQYPTLIKYQKIGTSYDNRDILMLRFGTGKKGIFLSSGVHGRESINPIVLLKMLSFCGKVYQSGGKIADHSLKKISKDYTFYFIPLLNPDGFAIALEGFQVIRNKELQLLAKSLKIPFAEWKFNARGIDINRNFPASSWTSKSPKDYPGSEKETKALMQVFKTIPSIAYIDYHSRGKMIYYYRNSMDKSYNQNQYKIAKKLQKITGYLLEKQENEILEGDSGGNTVHYYSECFKKPAITIETIADAESFPLCPNLQKETFEEIVQTPFYFLF